MCARAFFTKFSAVLCASCAIIRQDLWTSRRKASKIILFFGSPGKTGIVSTGLQFCGNHRLSILREPSKASCRGRPAFWPGSSLQKAILLPTGCVCFEQEKRGSVYPHLVQLSLEDFSAFCIIIVTGTKAFRKGKVCPCGALFFFVRMRRVPHPVRILFGLPRRPKQRQSRPPGTMRKCRGACFCNMEESGALR